MADNSICMCIFITASLCDKSQNSPATVQQYVSLIWTPERSDPFFELLSKREFALFYQMGGGVKQEKDSFMCD